jgi:lipopolysaccharide export system protein LptA
MTPTPTDHRVSPCLLADLRRALRKISVCALLFLPAQAGMAQQATSDPETDPSSQGTCRASPTDPRIEELLQRDATNRDIEVTSDTGDMSRTGDAVLNGNVQIRMGQRLLTADEAEIDAEKRSVRLKGDVEYLDPTLRVTGQGGSFQEEGIGEFEGAKFELLDRSVRGAAASASVRDAGRIIDLEGVQYTACPAGSDDWKLRADGISIDQKTQIGTGRDVRLDFLGVPIFYMPWALVSGRRPAQVGPAFPDVRQQRARPARKWPCRSISTSRRTMTRQWSGGCIRDGACASIRIALPRREHAQPAQRRIPVSRHGAWRREGCPSTGATRAGSGHTRAC